MTAHQPRSHAPATDVGAYSLIGSLGTPGEIGPGFVLTAASHAPLPTGTTVIISATDVPEIGPIHVTGGSAHVATVSTTSRMVILTAAVAAGASLAMHTRLSQYRAFALEGVSRLPADYVGTGAKVAARARGTLTRCTAD
jgi:hypothetical protein